jgi:lysophospholipase L1-like esterase
VFYVANTIGKYSYYGGLTVADGEIAFFTYNGSWSKVALEDVASKSEVKAKFTELSSQVVFDVSEYNKVDNKPKTYTDLSEALTDVPVSKCHGGMSIRYIQSFDNKYVQYRLISQNFSIIESDWQGVDDLSLKNSEDDLELADENGNVLMILSGGNIKTKNFNSETDAPFNSSSSLVDFEISDEQKNVLLQILNGNIKTKYFDSSILPNIEWGGKKLSILGDSISTFGVPDQNNATGTWTYAGNRCRYPQSNLFTSVEYQYWYKLIQKLGMTLGINESWAGSRVSNTQATDSGDLGPNRCMASLTRIGHLGENGTPDLIIVYGGTNDAGGSVTLGTFDTTNPKNYTEEEIASLPVDTFANAYRTMLVRLQYYYPLAKIVCCFPNYTSSYYTITNLDKYEEIIREACDFFGVEYIDLRTIGVNVYNTSTYLPDGIHPNANGMELIYKTILKKII